MITTELQNPVYHHQKSQMQSIRSQIISLQCEIATQPNLTRSIRSEYQHMALLYDRILRHRKIIVNKKDTVWNWAFNMPCKSLKGILVLFGEETHQKASPYKLRKRRNQLGLSMFTFT